MSGSAAVPSLRSGQALAAPVRHRAPSTWLSLLTGAVLLLGTGCSLLDPLTGGSSDTPVHSVDPNVPFVVVTVGGSPGATPTLSVAETIPDSTPLPRMALPTPDPAAARPSPAPNGNNRASAAARAAPPAASPRVP